MMECVIVAGNVKTFGKAIHSLAKIGIDLYVEVLDEGLSLRTVNSSRSAFASITFCRAFFQSYVSGRTAGESSNTKETIKCIVDMKACHAIFRSLQAIEKSVQRCILKMDENADKFQFKLFCTHDIVHAYELACIESNPLLAVFSKEACCNYIAAFPKYLIEVFQSFQDEVTLSTTTDIITLENYVEEYKDTEKILHTKLHIEIEEFHVYKIQRETNVTFSSKELKAALFFSEMTDHPVEIHFDGPGKPIVFVVSNPDQWSSDFVLATLDGNNNNHPPCQSTDTSVTDEHSILKKASRKMHERSTRASPIPSTSAESAVAESVQTYSINVVPTVLLDDDANKADDRVASPPHKRTRSIFISAVECSEVVDNTDEILASDTDTDDDTFRNT